MNSVIGLAKCKEHGVYKVRCANKHNSKWSKYV